MCSSDLALRKLPGMGAYAFALKNLVFLVEQDDADIRAKAFPVKHNQTPISKCCGPLCPRVISRGLSTASCRLGPGLAARLRPFSTIRICHESLAVPHLHPERSPGGRRSHQPPAHDPSGHESVSTCSRSSLILWAGKLQNLAT